MNIFDEGLHERLTDVFHVFDDYCKSTSILYSIVADEQDLQGYLAKTGDIEEAQDLEEHMRLASKRGGVHLDVDKRKDGTLFTFTIEAIQDNNLYEQVVGHWQVQAAPYAMKGQKKSVGAKQRSLDYSLLSREKDAKRVRSKFYPIQRMGNVEAAKKSIPKLEDRLAEDQFKWGTGKHRRDQSFFPSSFGPTRTFGGSTTKEHDNPKVSRKKKKPLETLQKPNLRPIGLFGPLDKRQPESMSPYHPGGMPLSYGERRSLNASFMRKLDKALVIVDNKIRE